MAIVTFLNKINQLGIRLWLEDSQLKFKAPKGTWNNQIRDELVANKAEVIAYLQQLEMTRQENDIPAIEPVARSSADGQPISNFPLSFSQERLWFIDQLEEDSISYNIPIAVSIENEAGETLNVSHIEQAFNLIIARHENLRTIFPGCKGKAQQQILPTLEFTLDVVDLCHIENESTRRQEAQKRCQAEAKAPFNLATGPLLRAKIFKLTEQEHLLILNMHHIISDGWSMGVLVKEFAFIMAALSKDVQPDLPPLAIQYIDYSVWQRNWMGAEAQASGSENQSMLQKQLAYWQEKLAGVPESLNLPTDFPRPQIQDYAGGRQHFRIDQNLTRQLKQLAEKQGCTLYMVLLSVFNILLFRYSSQEDICIGSPVANRHYEGTESLIGLFINTLVLRNQINGDASFSSLLTEVKSTCLAAFEHQDTPFEKVVDLVQPNRNAAISPLFQVMFILQNTPVESLGNGMSTRPLDVAMSKFDITLDLKESPDGLQGSFEFCSALFKPQTIARMAQHFRAICQAVITTPEIKVGDIEFIDSAEKQQLLEDFNNNRVAYPEGQCLHHPFIAQAVRTPDEIAVVYQDEVLSYQQLYEQSQTLALYLQSVGVGPDKLVGLCVTRTPQMLVAMLAILQAGGAYVPLDPAYPEERLAHMLQDSRAGVVLTQEGIKDKLSGLLAQDVHLVTIDSAWQDICDRVEQLASQSVTLKQDVKPEHLGYIIYTSGSTGKAKGVAIEHRNAMALLNWAQEVYTQEELSGVLAATSISFDLSVYEIFLTLATGGKIILADNIMALPEVVRKICLSPNNEITLINTVPSAMEELVRLKAIPESVVTINLAGEPLSTRLVNKIYQHTGVERVYDLYGPSEDTTYSTFTLRKANGPQTIGVPINNTQAYVLDRFNNPVPVGVPGELHLAGDGVARGYLYRPEMTAEKFVANPFIADSRMYKTGDLVRWLEDGNLEYLGRIDTQVKIRGFRIEIGEIEARLNEHQALKEAVVVAQGQEADKRLVAFYVVAGDETTEPLSAETLRTHLQQTLPDYMLPAAFVCLSEIPLMPNGKINRLKLSDTDVDMESAQQYLAPRSAQEQQLVAIWAEVLGLAKEKIGINDNFFELGGDSIKTIQVVAKAIEQGIHMNTRDMFSYQNIAELLQNCATRESKDIIKEQGILSGDVPLSPIQQHFFEHNKADRHHYNQSVLLNLKTVLSEQALMEIVTALLQQHDVLRLRYSQQAQAWQQHYLTMAQMTPESYGLASFNIADRGSLSVADFVTSVCQQMQASLDLENGPIMRWVYFHGDENPENGGDQLAIIIHHLVIDGVSWRILLEDLNLLMGQQANSQPLTLAQKRSSYRNWVNSLSEWYETPEAQSDLSYWLAQSEKLASGVELVAGVADKACRQQDIQHHNVQLSKASTEKLLTHCHQAYGTDINDLLLSAVMISYFQSTGGQNLTIDLEGHGREQLHPAIDINRTLGWFTSLFPVHLSLSDPEDMGQSIKEVKSALHAIPNKGVGFPIFRYINRHEALKALPEAQVVFNFLGDFQAKNPEAADQYFSFSENSAGSNSADNREVSKLVTINGMVAFEQLSFNFSYPREWQGQAISQWQNHFIKALEALVEHCCDNRRMGYTPDDFVLLDATLGQLDSILPMLQQQRRMTLDNIQDIYPLTPLQSGILFETLIAQTEDNKGMYITQSAIGFHGQAEFAILQQAWQRVVNHYDALRMQVLTKNASGIDTGVQIIQKQVDAPIEFVDWGDKTDSQLKSACELRMAQNKRSGISFENGPLMRMSLLQGQTSSYLLFEQHHIMLDGWSQSIVLSNLFKLYQALLQKQDVVLPETAPYRAYVQLLLERDSQQESAYWQGYLSCHEEKTPLPMAHLFGPGSKTRVSAAKEQFDTARISLSKEDTLQLEQLLKANRLTMNNLLQFVWGLVLHLHSGNQSVTFGSVSSGRTGLSDIKHSDQMVGLCINTTPTCISFDRQQSLLSQLARMQEREAEKLGYEITPLVAIQELISNNGSQQLSSNEDFFQTLFVYENYPVENIAESSSLLKDFIGNEAPNYPLAVTALSQETLDISFTYDCYFYGPDSVAELMAQFKRITLQLLADPQMSIGELTLLSEQDKQRVLRQFNQTQLSYDQDKCIHDLVADQVAKHPNKTAVVYQGQSLSYQALFEKSQQLAFYLQGLGVKPDTLVGVCMERNAEMLVAMLGILQAGGAYLPMDPDYPVERLTYMLQDCQAKVVLTQAKLQPKLAAMVSSETQFIALDSQWQEVSDVAEQQRANRVALKRQVTAQNLAYVIYTSGSTGKPKGVMIEHRSLHALCVWHQKAFNLTENSKATQVANIAFDASVWEIWPCLINAASLYVVGNDVYTDIVRLNQFFCDHEITHSFLATPVAQQLLQLEALSHSHLQYLLIGGDKLSKYEDKNYPFTIVNNYGPTESTVVATSAPIEGSFTVQNIGRPVHNTQTYILDQYQNPVPVGVPGELHIAGKSLARGYLHRPGLTQEKFVTNPFITDEASQPSRMYKSGDLARWLPDGNIEYLGRMDNQVKIRGYRIETGEIEARFNQYPDIKDGAVVVQEQSDSGSGAGKQLVAFYVANATSEHETQEIPREQLTTWLLKTLPDYMVPVAFVSLTSMPLTPNGKVDRRALTAMNVALTSGQHYLAPRNPTEQKLVAIWADILAADAGQIGVQDNFFELGGDSIKIIQVVAKATAQHIYFDVRDMFNHQSIAELLAHCDVSKSREIIKEQGALSGAVPLSPVQSYFFEHSHTDMHHFNQSVLLNLHVHLSEADWQVICDTLVQQHDALRLRYRHSAAGWQQSYADDGNKGNRSAAIHSYHMGDIDTANIPEYVEGICNHWQASLDLENGPLMQWVHFNGGAESQDQLAIIIHHLVIDGVSWRILLEDLNRLIGQQLARQPLQLSAKRSSYRNWVASLAEYQGSEQGQRDLAYWTDLSQSVSYVEQAFEDKRYRHQDIQHHNVLLSKADTEKLVKHCHQAYGTEINDLLLTALMLSYYQSSGRQQLLLQMEGHGREQIHPAIDITQTLGWFTSLYPTHLVLSNPRDIGQSIKDIKANLHAIPNKGIGYSIFKYVNQHEAFQNMPEAQVVFNFLGDFQTNDHRDAEQYFSLSEHASGAGSSKQREAFKTVTINGVVAFEQLSFTFSYPSTWQGQRISQWQEHFISALEALVEHCCDTPRLGYTPDDFPLLSASLPQLDKIIPTLETQRHIPLSNIQDMFPLTPLQSGILFETLYARSDDNNGMYLTQSAMGFSGKVDKAILQQAWQLVVNHYDALRMQIVSDDFAADDFAGLDGGFQVIQKQVPVTIEEINCTDEPDAKLKSTCEHWMLESKRNGISFQQGPLMRMTLLQGQNISYLVFEQHHIMLDGWSQSIVLSNLFKLYQSLASKQSYSLPASAAWGAYVASILNNDKAAETEYWQGYLSQFEEKTPLPMVGLSAEHEIARERFNEARLLLSQQSSALLAQLVKDNRLTINTVLQYVWGLLLHLHSGNQTITFGSVSSGRSRILGIEHSEQMVGMCINTTPTCISFDDQLSLLEQLKRMQSRESEKLQFETTPLVDIQKILGGASNEDFFQSLFVYENYPVDKVSSGSDLITDVITNDPPNYPLTITGGSGDNIEVSFTWDSFYYSKETINTLMAQFERLMQQLIAQPEARIQSVTLLSESEQQQLLTQINQTQVAYTRHKCIHQLFIEQVRRSPEKTALVYQEQALTYQQLFEQSHTLARYLQASGVQPDSLVGICMDRSPNQIIAILGILMAGGAYVPMAPDYPEERLAWMLEDSKASMVLTQNTLQAKLSKLVPDNTQVVALDCQWAEISGGADSNANLQEAVKPQHLAYVIYTSGSTGKPKGVMVEHQGVVNTINWFISNFSVDENARLIQLTDYTFDPSVEDIFAALGTGATLYIPDSELILDEANLVNYIRQHSITGLNFVPGMLKGILCDYDKLDSIKFVISGGERLDASVKDAILSRGYALFNNYGPTETTVDALSMQCSEAPVMIGTPIANTQIYVLDQYHNPVPAGVPGQLHIAGDGLARGYLNRPDLTEQQFIANPFDSGAGSARLYKTGDLVRMVVNKDGKNLIEYLGRIDTQVKIRGFRIETGEIETRLNQHPLIKEGVVIAKGQEGNKQLVACYVAQTTAAQQESELAAEQIKTWLQQTLPEYMVPVAFINLEAMPLTYNGKVDRRVLENLEVNIQSGAPYIAPRNELEKQLATIWADVLQMAPEKIGINDNFFELGGHSLLATQVISKIRSQLHIDIPMKALFSATTLVQVAEVTQAIKGQQEKPQVEVDLADDEFEELSL